MNKEESLTFDERTLQAIHELQGTISDRYPTASFELSRAADDPASIHLVTVVDVDDPDEVADLVVDRVIELQVDEQIPIHVIPLRTPERVATYRAEQHQAGRPTRRSLPLLGKLSHLGR
jgi:hypothetical protein